jgi:hypothetical protein
MKPITYYTDSAAARSFAHVYGDRLQHLDKPQKMYMLLALGLSLFTDSPVGDTVADLDEDGDQDEAFVLHICDQFDGQDERTIVQMMQAVAMTLEDEP